MRAYIENAPSLLALMNVLDVPRGAQLVSEYIERGEQGHLGRQLPTRLRELVGHQLPRSEEGWTIVLDAEQLEELFSEATIKPRYVQNRCYTSLLWDAEVRSVCAQHEIVYQGFSLSTANIPFLNHPVVTEIADAHQKWPAQIVFRYCLDIGILPITGTSDVLHMKGDLACSTFSLSKEHHEALNAVSEQFAGGLTQL